MDFPAAFYRVSHIVLLDKLRSIGIGGQLLSMVSQFLCATRQRVRLDGKVSALVDVVRECTRVAF